MGVLLALTWQSKPEQLHPLLALAPPDLEEVLAEIKKIPIRAFLRRNQCYGLAVVCVRVWRVCVSECVSE